MHRYLESKPTKIGKWLTKQKNKKFIAILKANGIKTVLEIGPGKGQLADLCRDNGFKYESLDKNPVVCEIMRKKDFVCHNKEVPPLDILKKYDAIICCNVIEHLKTYKSIEEIMYEISSHLSDKGIAIIEVPEIKYWKWYFWICSVEHFFPTSKKRMEYLCKNAGLKIVLSEIWLDCFRERFAKLIWYATRLILPFGKVLSNIRHKYPSVVIVARRWRL